MGRVALWVVVGWCVAGCSSSEVVVAHKIPLSTASEPVPEEQLLDIGIVVFDSGVPEGEVDKEVLEELIREGTFVHIRRSESIYMSVLLRNTLQKTGNWGSVWITPKETTAADLSIAAKIVHSDGADLRLVVTAKDSTGRVWLNAKQYEVATAAGAFNRQRFPDLDPYQDAFNSIANDLAEEAVKLTSRDLRNVRAVTDLRYAADVSPEAFNGYVGQDKRGLYTLNRLPAAGDPMFDRTQRVRQRERLFLDTLDQHYAQFSAEATQPYNSWREYAREEAIEIRELTKSARFRTIMGAATIAASIIYGQQSDGTLTERLLRDALMYVGVDMIRASQVRKQEKRIHTETLEELSSSFDADIKPMVVEIQGTQHRLAGTADAQYDEWRGLLRQIFITESGFVPEDVSIYTEPEPEPPVELPLVPEPAPEAAPAGDTPPATGVETTTEAAADANASASAGT
jgi:predicted nuclease with TOPRIM domain